MKGALLPPWIDGSRGLFSLYDMFTTPAYKLVNLGSSLRWMEESELFEGVSPDIELSRRESLKKSAEVIAKLMVDIGCEHSARAAARLARDIPEIIESAFRVRVKELRAGFVEEMQTHLFFYVPIKRAKYYEKTEEMFGDFVKDRFPSARNEIHDAGACFACGLYTASVFHLMRVMEIALRSVSLSFGITLKPTENWGDLLRKISSDELKKTSGPYAVYLLDKNFYDGVRASFAAVKDAWRNTTMHFERSYSETEAEEIIGAVRTFMRCLAARLDETGKLFPPP